MFLIKHKNQVGTYMKQAYSSQRTSVRSNGVLRMGASCGLAVVIVALCMSGSLAAQRSDGWKRVDPSSVGVDAKKLDAVDAQIKAKPEANIDHLVVIRCGNIVFDQRYPHDYVALHGAKSLEDSGISPKGGPVEFNYLDPKVYPYYHGSDLHSVQSVSKSITSVLYGVAFTRGDFKSSLDTPVLNFFKGKPVKEVDDRKRHMTIRNLLTMRSGLDWPDGKGYDDPINSAMHMEHFVDDWPQYIIDHPMANEPGSTMHYSDGDAVLLSYIFQQETGQTLADYATKYLFTPLGVRDSYWRKSPLGLPDSEGGLFLRPQDLAKVGQLYLQQGMWNGKRIVSADWVKQSTTPAPNESAATSRRGGQEGLLWSIQAEAPGRDFNYSAHGYGGQGMWVVPKRNLVMVINAWKILPGGAGGGINQNDVLSQVLAATSDSSCPASR
jgi:CubicO group peptidase (beta-lactamase class C family)